VSHCHCYKPFEYVCGDHKLCACSDTDTQYTYRHESLGRYSVIDRIFVGIGLLGNITKYATVDSGVNLSA